MQPASFKTISRSMLSADRIVRAKRAHPQSLSEMILDVPRLLHETAEGTLRVGAPCVKENAKLLGHGVRVDSFANRTGRITTGHGERLDQEMRKSVQQHIGPARERTLNIPVLRPVLVSPHKGIEALLHRPSRKPVHYSGSAKLEKYSLAAVLHRGKPSWF